MFVYRSRHPYDPDRLHRSYFFLKNGRWKVANAIFIGDRVAPETIDINNGVIVVRKLDRRPDESMDVMPSVAKVLELELVGGHLEVLQS